VKKFFIYYNSHIVNSWFSILKKVIK